MDDDMPRPLSGFKPPYDVSLDIDQIAKNTAPLVQLALVVIASARLDLHLALILASLMRTKEETAIAIYTSLAGGNAQRDILNAAAAQALSGDDKLLFDAITRLAGSVQKERNNLVHGITATCDTPEMRDSLLVGDYKVMLALTGGHVVRGETVSGLSPLQAQQKAKTLADATQVHRTKDIHRLVKQIERVVDFIVRFVDPALDAAARKRLFDEPEIQEQVKILRAKGQKKPD